MIKWILAMITASGSALLIYFFAAPLIALSAEQSLLAAVLTFGLLLSLFGALALRAQRRLQPLTSLEQDLVRMASVLSRLSDEIETLRSDVTLEKGRNQNVVAELKVLQTLLNQVVSRSGRKVLDRPVAKADREGAKQVHASDAVYDNTAPQSNIVNNTKRPMDMERLEQVVHTALSENRVDLYLQPIVTLPNRKQTHYECVSRVRDEHGETFYPEQFLPFVEEHGIVGTLDNLLLFRCIQLVRRLGSRRPESRFFCNISSASLADEEFFLQFMDYMGTNAVLADRLIFEFSYSDVQTMQDRIAEPLRKLSRKGFRYSLDHVTTLQIDGAVLFDRGFGWIKPDADLFDAPDLPIDTQDYVANMRRHGLHVIGSRVETEAQVLRLLDLNFRYAQGFLFGKPRLSREEPHPSAVAGDL